MSKVGTSGQIISIISTIIQKVHHKYGVSCNRLLRNWDKRGVRQWNGTKNIHPVQRENAHDFVLYKLIMAISHKSILNPLPSHSHSAFHVLSLHPIWLWRNNGNGPCLYIAVNFIKLTTLTLLAHLVDNRMLHFCKGTRRAMPASHTFKRQNQVPFPFRSPFILHQGHG